MEFDTTCNTGLGLGIQTEKSDHHQHQQKKKKLCLRYDHLLPSLTLGLSDDTIMLPESDIKIGGAAGDNNLQQLGSSLSALSSFCDSVRVKKEVRENYGNNIDEDEEGEEEEEELERVSNSRVSDEDEDGGGGNNTPRKKLRLTKEQSAVLEESFKEHSTLNPKQKHALAERLNLRPRQVEVWFQNRRARTKLKQTEVDCEFLKRCCETLTEENKRLQKELQELKSLHKTVPFYLQQPAAALAICPSCQKIATAGHDGGSSKSTFSFGPKPYFFNPFSHPSAASC